MEVKFRNEKEKERYESDVMATAIIEEYNKEQDIFVWMTYNGYDFKDILIFIHENVTVEMDEFRANIIIKLIEIYVEMLDFDNSIIFGSYVNNDVIIDQLENDNRKLELLVMELTSNK